jgi:hypothetical protein
MKVASLWASCLWILDATLLVCGVVFTSMNSSNTLFCTLFSIVVLAAVVGEPNILAAVSLRVHCNKTEIVTMSAIPRVAEEDSGRKCVIPERWNLVRIIPDPLVFCPLSSFLPCTMKILTFLPRRKIEAGGV